MKKRLFLLLSIFALTSCNIYDRVYGPYHHEVTLNKPIKYISVNDDTYCQIETSVYKISDNQFEKVLFNNIDETILDFNFYKDKFYVATAGALKVYDENFNYLSNFIDFSINTFLVIDDLVYYNNLSEFSNYLCSTDINTKESVIVQQNFNNSIYTGSSRAIYANEQGCLYFLDELTYTNYSKGVVRRYSMSFVNNTDVGLIKIEGDKITITYKEETYSINNSQGEFFFVNSISCNNDKLTFATYEYIYNNDCNYYKCFCHYGTSRIFEFDFDNRSLTLSKELPVNSYILNLSHSEVTYYFNGSVFQNDNKICDIEKIQPKGEYTQRGRNISLDGKTKWADYIIDYYNEKVCLKKYDYTDSLLNEYIV